MLKKFTASDNLLYVLDRLMSLSFLADFRLVGGTALSLLRGHRASDDIDLFTYKEYGTVPFAFIEQELKAIFPEVLNPQDEFPELKKNENHFGLHLYIGQVKDALIKVDIINWNEDFLFPMEIIDNIRFASVPEIAIMKLDVISRGGRKKDFWDLSEILDEYSLSSLLELYKQKHPYNDIHEVCRKMIDFSVAEEMPDPICFKGKRWELIKEEMQQEVRKLS